jgi:IPTL-CTERM motif
LIIFRLLVAGFESKGPIVHAIHAGASPESPVVAPAETDPDPPSASPESILSYYFNTTGAVSSTNGATGGTASAPLVVPADPIPAVSDWGLVLMSGLTIVAGFFALRRRQRRSV